MNKETRELFREFLTLVDAFEAQLRLEAKRVYFYG